MNKGLITTMKELKQYLIRQIIELFHKQENNGIGILRTIVLWFITIRLIKLINHQLIITQTLIELQLDLKLETKILDKKTDQ